jgi:hypothetical protein
MGGETTATGKPRIRVNITGDAEIDKLEIVRDHRIIYAARGSGKKAAFEFVDQTGNPDHRPTSYYYLRITQKDEGNVWSSPVWVNWKQS